MPSDRFTPYVAVFVVLKNDKNEYLLLQRANTGYLDGYYEYPAGHLERYESLHECAVREVKEEVGVDIKVEDLKLIHINQNDIDKPYLNFTFVCSKWEGKPLIREPEKCSDMQFFALYALPEKRTLNLRLLEKNGFKEELTYSNINPEAFETIMNLHV